jgi:hypothetical protein
VKKNVEFWLLKTEFHKLNLEGVKTGQTGMIRGDVIEKGGVFRKIPAAQFSVCPNKPPAMAL